MAPTSPLSDGPLYVSGGRRLSGGEGCGMGSDAFTFAIVSQNKK